MLNWGGCSFPHIMRVTLYKIKHYSIQGKHMKTLDLWRWAFKELSDHFTESSPPLNGRRAG